MHYIELAECKGLQPNIIGGLAQAFGIVTSCMYVDVDGPGYP